MTTTVHDLLLAVAIGGGATAVMDGWHAFLRRAFGVASLDYCLLGRWVAHMPRGIVRHHSIVRAQPHERECALGWVAHYSIGVVFAVVFAALASDDWLARPTPVPPLLFGLATVVFPFLVLQPSLGLGIAAAKTPHPARARAKSVLTHLVFGLGLYVSAMVARHVLG